MTSAGHDERGRDEERAAEQPDWLGAVSRKLGDQGSTPEERLEQLLAERRRELEEHAGSFESAVSDLERRDELVRDAHVGRTRATSRVGRPRRARGGPRRPLHELTKREARISAEEAALAGRRSELGAVELKRAAVEQRERHSPPARPISRCVSRRSTGARKRRAGSRSTMLPSPLLAFVPGASYRLVEIERPGLAAGDMLEVEEEDYVVGRVGPSPLPGDARRCAYSFSALVALRPTEARRRAVAGGADRRRRRARAAARPGRRGTARRRGPPRRTVSAASRRARRAPRPRPERGAAA
jgi:hypothetical protein